MIALIVVIASFLWVWRAFRREMAAREREIAATLDAMAEKERADAAETQLRTVAADFTVLTVQFTEGPIEQNFYITPAKALARKDKLSVGDYAGDGRRIVCVQTFQPFNQK